MEKRFIYILPLVAAGCKSSRHSLVNQAIATDSTGRQAEQLSVVNLDSLMRHSELTFDTLRLEIRRPLKAETISARMINGRFERTDRRKRLQTINSQRQDTVSLSRKAMVLTRTDSETTAVQSPANGTAIGTVALLLAAIFALIWLRLRK